MPTLLLLKPLIVAWITVANYTAMNFVLKHYAYDQMRMRKNRNN